MKLNKVLALALSGVMAVSMLAGCSDNGSNGNGNGEPVAPSTAAGKVVAALDGDTTEMVKFTAGSDLQDALDKVVENAGADVKKVTVEALANVDSSLSKEARLPFVWGTEANDKKEQSATWIITLDSTVGVNEAYAVKKIASEIDGYGVGYTSSNGVSSDGSVVCADLAEQSKTYTDSNNKEYWYNFEYTGEVAVAVVNDAVTGQSTYVAAVTVTRTPTKVEK